MKNKIILFAVLIIGFGISNTNAQINLGEKALGAIGKAVKGFTFTDEEAALLSKETVDKMDKENPIAGPNDPYTIRLNKLFAKHASENGLALNFKVYTVKDINAFATADGSVRVFSGLMDIMDDNEILAVIGHEIGHVANHDTRDAIKAAYKKEALLDGVSSQSGKIATISESQLAKLGNAVIDSRHSRKQETDADLYAYDFMKRNGYNVNAVESAFTILANMNQTAEAGIIERMLSSHPDPRERATLAKQKAEADGLYKPYVKNEKVTTKKKITKRKITKKKITTKK